MILLGSTGPWTVTLRADRRIIDCLLANAFNSSTWPASVANSINLKSSTLIRDLLFFLIKRKFQNFKKISKFQKNFKISKIQKISKNFKISKNIKISKFQKNFKNFKKISKIQKFKKYQNFKISKKCQKMSKIQKKFQKNLKKNEETDWDEWSYLWESVAGRRRKMAPVSCWCSCRPGTWTATMPDCPKSGRDPPHVLHVTRSACPLPTSLWPQPIVKYIYYWLY